MISRGMRSLAIAGSLLSALFAYSPALGQMNSDRTLEAGLWGGGGGGRCHTATSNDATWQLDSIRVRSGSWLDAIELGYRISDSSETRYVSCGGQGGAEGGSLKLEPGEYITRVRGRYGLYVDLLIVETNLGRVKEFGSVRGNPPRHFDYRVPPGMAITGLTVNSGDYVDAIGVVVRQAP